MMKLDELHLVNQLTQHDITEYSQGYAYNKIPNSIKRNKGYLNKDEFLEICMWKSKRQKANYETNDSAFIKEITKISFSPKTSEKLRIEILTLLKGVNYAVGSAILHIGYRPEHYPIMDFRALWSLYGINKDEIKYTPELWEKYCKDCRKLSKKISNTVDNETAIRTLDKALWQYSKDMQKN